MELGEGNGIGGEDLMAQKLKLLQSFVDAAWKNWSSLSAQLYQLQTEKRAVQTEKYKQLEELKRKLDDEIEAEFGERIRQAAHLVEEADAVYLRAKADRTKAKLLFPEGTVFDEWVIPKWEKAWKRTGKRAVLKVRTPDLSIRSRWPPSVGEAGFLYLKKDGKPSQVMARAEYGTAWSVEGSAMPPVERLGLTIEEKEEIEL